MAICTKCDGLYPGRRLKLGYKTCLECGEEDANEESAKKAECVAPLFNKGPLGYIYSKGDAKDAGK